MLLRVTSGPSTARVPAEHRKNLGGPPLWLVPEPSQSGPDKLGRKPLGPRRDTRQDAIGEPSMLRGLLRPIVGTGTRSHRQQLGARSR